jgi:3-(3-hydroxy-phenyl)propionate hydroxylase
VWASEHWLGAGLMPQLTEATEALPLPAELLVTEDYPGAAAHTVLLIRPDGHLVAALQGCRQEDLYDLADRARSASAELPAPRPGGADRGASRAGSRGADREADRSRERLTAGQS